VRLKVYLVVSFVISYVNKIISVFWRSRNILLKNVVVFAKKPKGWEKNPVLSKKSKRGYKRLFLICLRQVLNERIQTSIIHISPCS
jgi:hypothetical protein